MKTLNKILTASAAAMMLSVTLSSCASNSETPENVAKEYVEAISTGKYGDAISLVNDPGDLKAEDVVLFQPVELSGVKVESEPLPSDAESGTVTLLAADQPVSIPVQKVEGSWKVSKPELFAPYNHTEMLSELSDLNELGSLAVLDSEGKEVKAASGYTVIGADENATLRTIALSGKYVPDQKFDYDSQDGDLSKINLDTGNLSSTIATFGEELAYVSSHYDAAAKESIIQTGAPENVSCKYKELVAEARTLGSDLDKGVIFTCEFNYPTTDTAGKDFLITDSLMTSDFIDTDSKWSTPSTAISTTSGFGCQAAVGRTAGSSEGDKFEIVVANNALTFNTEGSEQEVLEKDAVTDSCNTFNPDLVGKVIKGISNRTASDTAPSKPLG